MSKFAVSFQVLLIFTITFSIAEPCSDVGTNSAKWVIVFDAGSTKTKIHLFQFRMEEISTKWIPLDSKNKRWERGLSTFDPKTASVRKTIRNGIDKLLQFAAKTIKGDEQRETPVFLYATAGLRRLSRSTSKTILDICKEAIKRSNFDKLPKNGMPRVKIISGIEEAQFSWLSINYLLFPNIKEQTSKDDFGVLDMGGGSTQISFRPNGDMVRSRARVIANSLWYPDEKTEDGRKASGPGVYSRSFPDFGFETTLMKYVGAYSDCVIKGQCQANKYYESVCLHPDFTRRFKFGPYKFNMKGKAIENSERFEKCTAIAREIFRTSKKIPKTEIKLLLKNDKSKFFAVGGFYYLAKAMEGADPLKQKNLKSHRCKGFRMTLSDFHQGAQELCKNPDNTGWFLPMNCIRASYTFVLFQDIYNFRTDTVFNLCKKLPVTIPDGSTKTVSIGWPLGVAQQAAEKVLEKIMFM